ncbi:MAG: DALR anticodon-binding domain-containing protein [Sneathiella sp.]
MAENQIAHVRKVIETVFKQVIEKQKMSPSSLEKLTVRTPKSEAWGDLCSNALLLLCGDDETARQREARDFIKSLEALPFIDTVTLAQNGYLNMTVAMTEWAELFVDILDDYPAFIQSAVSTGLHDLQADIAPRQNDLVCARLTWNAEALEKLARQVGSSLTCREIAEPQQRGFPTETAIARCSEQGAKLAVLSNGVDFAVNFSPVLAADRSYDNPAFCLPYCIARIRSMLEHASVKDEGSTLLADVSVTDFAFKTAIEQKLAKMIWHWPEMIEITLEKGEILHLLSFLHEVSLLFFQLVEQMRPQSSEYLMEPGQGAMRCLLFRVIAKIVSEGLMLLEFDIAEEFI